MPVFRRFAAIALGSVALLGTSAPALVYRSGCLRKSTTSAISALAPSYPATSANVVLGCSSSKTLARDRPTPSAPCSPLAAPLDIRRKSQMKNTIGSPKVIRKISTEVPKPFPDGTEEICTLCCCRSVSRTWPACGGTTTVKLFPLVNVPVLVPPDVLASCTVFT